LRRSSPARAGVPGRAARGEPSIGSRCGWAAGRAPRLCLAGL